MGEGGDVAADRKSRSDAAPLGGRHLGAAALLLATSIFLSRVMGFVREMVLAAQVGAGRETDAYYAAFQLPDLLNYLLAGGALAIAFTPLYLRVRGERGEAEAEELFRTVLGTLGALVLLLSALLWLNAERLIALQFSSFDAETRALTVRLTRIVLPGQIFFVTGGIVRAVLMAHGRFGAQAAAPLLYNGGVIAGGLATGSVEGFAWGALVGAIVGTWAYPIWDMRHIGPVGLRVAPFDARFRRYLWLALPLMLGLSLTTVDEWYERWFGATLGVGVVATLGFARRLMMAPVAVIGQAVAAAALPTLSRLHAEGREQELEQTLVRTLQATLVVAVFCAAAVCVFSQPLVEVMYRRGHFTGADAARVASVLSVLALAVPGWVSQQVAVRAFFARGDTWRPMLLGTVIALAVIPLYLAMGERFAAEGLAAAGVAAISLNAVATLVWARLRYGGPKLSVLAATTARSVALAVPAALLGALTRSGAAGMSGAMLDLALGGAVFVGVALLCTRWLGDEIMRETLRRLTDRAAALLRR